MAERTDPNHDAEPGGSAAPVEPGALLADGSYDALVVDATEIEAGDGSSGPTLRLELTVLAGPHKGELVAVTAGGLGRDPLDLLAVPATLVVAGGSPTVTLEG